MAETVNQEFHAEADAMVRRAVPEFRFAAAALATVAMERLETTEGRIDRRYIRRLLRDRDTLAEVEERYGFAILPIIVSGLVSILVKLLLEWIQNRKRHG